MLCGHIFKYVLDKLSTAFTQRRFGPLWWFIKEKINDKKVKEQEEWEQIEERTSIF